MANDKNPNVVAAAGIAGAVIGAGVTAAAVAMSDKKNREKVAHVMKDLQKQAVDALTHTKDVIADKADDMDLTMDGNTGSLHDITEPASKTDDKILKSL